MTCLSPYSRGLWCAWASGFTSMHVSPSIDMRQVWSGVTTQKSCELMHGCTSGPNGEGRRVRAVQFNGIYSCIRHRGMCLLGHFLLISATRENRAPHMTLWNRHIILVIRYWLGNVFKVQFKQTEKKKTSQMKVYGFALCSPAGQSESVWWLNRPPLFVTASCVTLHHQF